MPRNAALGFRCASINEIKPVPVPTSNTHEASPTFAKEPSKTPSVPTRKTFFDCIISKYLKVKGFTINW